MANAKPDFPTHTLCAPNMGLVASILIKLGEYVEQNQPLLIIEAMKVQTSIVAEQAGIVTAVLSNVDEEVYVGQALIEMDCSNAPSKAIQQEALAPNPVKQNDVLLQAFADRQKQTLDESRLQQQAKRHSKSYLSARENLAKLCDPDSFIEYGQFAVAAQRLRRDYQELKTDTAADGVITGIASINASEVGATNSRTAVIINDYSVLAGTQGYYHHRKLDRILEVASAQQLPIIMYAEGGGGRPGDTDITTVNSGLNCQSFSTWAKLAGTVPRIAVANGYCFAGNAALFGAADITIATINSWIGMAGPAMIEGGGLGSFAATEIGPIHVQQKNGVVDIVADDEAHAARLARQCLSYFQKRNPHNSDIESGQWSCADQLELRQILPDDRRFVYDIRTLITSLADNDSFIELKAGYGGAIITGFIRLQGQAIGLLASDCKVLGGAIDVDAGDKASEFISLCNNFAIPIVSLCDTPGFMVGPEHEKLAAVRRLSKMFVAGGKVTVPFIAVIVRKCYGLGAQALLGGSTSNPHYTVSWPNGEFGGMGLEGAVKLGFKKQLAALQDPEARQALYDKLVADQYQRGQASEVASILEIDAVIDPADTRKTILLALQNHIQTTTTR